MLLGSKLTPYIKYNNLGTKNWGSGQQLGNKKNPPMKRVVLPLPAHNTVMRTSPIEKYHTNNH